MAETLRIGPQPGYQEAMLATPADIAVGGGAAGAGKTWSLLAETVRHKDVKGFGSVTFRRTSPQITAKGSLWEQTFKIYPHFKAVPTRMKWTFPSGVTADFSHLEDIDSPQKNWLGSEVPLLNFDQLETFWESQFWFMLSRNRSVCGVRPYVRATCNPVPDDDEVGGWLNKLVAWWIDEDGFPILDRAGVIRWFMRLNEQVVWADTKAALREMVDLPDEDFQPKSFTFIPGRLDENKILISLDPGYRANLLAQDPVTRARLLGGNWKVKATAGKVFNRAWFKTVLQEAPKDVVKWIRYWDKAATEADKKKEKAGLSDGPAYSAGVLMGILPDKRAIIADVQRGRWSAAQREVVIGQTARADAARYGDVDTWFEQEPGSGGKESAENSVLNLSGYVARVERPSKNKLSRAQPLSAAAEAGNVLLVNFYNSPEANLERLLVEMQNFDGYTGRMDQVDGCSGAFNKLFRGVATSPLDVVTGPAGVRSDDAQYQEEVARIRAAYGGKPVPPLSADVATTCRAIDLNGVK